MAQGLNGISGRVRRWRQYRATVRELTNLTPREMDDLGISPYEIQTIARQAVNNL